MLVLAQVSDLHLALPPRLSELASKRGLGFINWQRKRKFIHRPEILHAVINDLERHDYDHLAVTGDLVNLSLPTEYRLLAEWLRALGSPQDITVIPGNHDVYVRGVEEFPAQFWGDYMRGDDGLQRFPFLRRRGHVAVIALSSGLPTAPLLATGKLGARQLERLADMLDQTSELFRVVLIHHPPVTPPRRRLRRLLDAAEFRHVLAKKGAELVLHGHDHRRTLVWLEGPRGMIPAVGAPSASAAASHGDEDSAGYNLFFIDGAPAAWRCELVPHQRETDGTIRELDHMILAPSSPREARVKIES